MLYGNKPDDKRYMEIREARMEYIRYAREVERLEYKMNNDKLEVYENRENLEKTIERRKEDRDALEATFHERFGVQGYEGLTQEQKRLDLEKYGITDRTKEQKGSQDGQGVLVSKMEDIEAIQQNLRNMKEASDTGNYELFHIESQKALERLQEISRQIGYSKQLLNQEMESGNRRSGKNHSSALHPEIEKTFSGESRESRLTFKEKLEKFKRECDAEVEKKKDPGRER